MAMNSRWLKLAGAAAALAGVLAFVEFPYQGSDTLTFSRAKVPRL